MVEPASLQKVPCLVVGPSKALLINLPPRTGLICPNLIWGKYLLEALSLGTHIAIVGLH